MGVQFTSRDLLPAAFIATKHQAVYALAYMILRKKQIVCQFQRIKVSSDTIIGQGASLIFKLS